MFSGCFLLIAQEAEQDPLYSAVIRADMAKAKEVIASGADMNRQSDNGYTPLMWACTYSSRAEYAGVAKLLIAEGADVNRAAVDGTTALMEAAGNSREIFDLLLEKGADIRALRENGTGVLTSSIFGVLMGSVSLDLVDFVLSKGLDINEASKSGDAIGWTPLHFAVANGKDDLVTLLIRNGANVNAVAEGGFTPLLLAENNEYEEIVKQLKAAGAK
jgi:ankyrin repeat protein